MSLEETLMAVLPLKATQVIDENPELALDLFIKRNLSSTITPEDFLLYLMPVEWGKIVETIEKYFTDRGFEKIPAYDPGFFCFKKDNLSITVSTSWTKSYNRQEYDSNLFVTVYIDR